MRIAFDTNVVLDVLLARKAFLPEAVALFEYVWEGRMEGVLAATSLTTAFYLIERKRGAEGAYAGLDRLMELFEAGPVDRRVLHSVRALGFENFEEAVLHESARRAGASGIVTRNARDFGSATLSIYHPEELLAAVENASR